MNWNRLFATRAAQMRRSAVRELLKLTEQPGIISFAGGLPAAELFPLDRCAEVAHSILTRHGRRVLQYGPTEGLAELREWIAARFRKAGVDVQPANVAIVSGAQQGLDLVGRVFLNRGDRVIVENPTYLALLSAWRPLGVEFLPVAGDSEGMNPETIESLLGQRPKLIYSIPNFNNPQGTTLSLRRRHELIRLVQQHELILLEDDPYGELRYDSDPLPSLLSIGMQDRSLDTGHTIHIGTFSKTLMPGLRVGWVVAPEPVIDKIVQAKQSSDLHTSTFNQHLAWGLVADGLLDRHIPMLQGRYRERRDAMVAALHRHLPETVTWHCPAGGMFLMLTLPRRTNAGPLLTRALQRQVAFVPGEDFHADGGGQNTIRLNFTQTAPPLIEEGIRRLAGVLTGKAPLPCSLSRSDGASVFISHK